MHLPNTFPGYVGPLGNKTLQKTQGRHINPVQNVTNVHHITPGKTVGTLCYYGTLRVTWVYFGKLHIINVCWSSGIMVVPHMFITTYRMYVYNKSYYGGCTFPFILWDASTSQSQNNSIQHLIHPMCVTYPITVDVLRGM
jgi:hypothetical protein